MLEVAEVEDTEGGKAAESRGDGAGHWGVGNVTAGVEPRPREIDNPAGCEVTGDSGPVGTAVGIGIPIREEAGRVIGDAGLEWQQRRLVAGVAGGCGGACGGVAEDEC